MKRFKKVTPFYTGGGVYCFIGELQDGAFFLASTSFDDVIELDTDPETVPDDNLYTWEWQEVHALKIYDRDTEETTKFFISLLNWIIKHEPKGPGCNYQLYDIKERLKEYKTVLKK